MAPAATIYSWPNDPRVARALALAKIGGLDFQAASDFQFGVTNKTEDFLSKFPLGKIPAMETSDGFCVAESGAIAYYAAVTGNKAEQLLGADPKTKSKILEWAFFSNDEINANAMPIFVMCVLKSAPADAQRYATLLGNFERALGKVETTLKKGNGKFLVGDAITYADLMVFAPTSFAGTYLFDSELRKKFPAVTKYIEGLAAIPEVKESFGEIKWTETAVKP